MKLFNYEQIIRDIKQTNQMSRKMCVEKLLEIHPDVPKDTLISIHSLFYQRKIKKTFKIHHRKENIRHYYEKYKKSVYKRESCGFVFRLALKLDFPPTLLVRIILEQFFLETSFSDKRTVPKGRVSKFLKDPSLLSNTILEKEVEICIANDDHCGPSVEHIKRETGLFYEKVLHDILTAQDIPYYDEEILRNEGYDKTPDFKLVVPISVNNYVINWIESKASFGDQESHSGYLENQFWSYTNRFGPGLVIYWFGFIDELNINIDQGIMLSEKFPVDVVKLETLLREAESKFSLSF